MITAVFFLCCFQPLLSHCFPLFLRFCIAFRFLRFRIAFRFFAFSHCFLLFYAFALLSAFLRFRIAFRFFAFSHCFPLFLRFCIAFFISAGICHFPSAPANQLPSQISPLLRPDLPDDEHHCPCRIYSRTASQYAEDEG